MKLSRSLSHMLLFAYAIVLFITDQIILAFAAYPLLQLIPLFMMIQILYKQTPTLLAFSFFLLLLFSMSITGMCLPYATLILGNLALIKLLSFYCPAHRNAIAFASVPLISLTTLLFFPPIGSFLLYTILSITGNMITMYFSLKWFSAVK